MAKHKMKPGVSPQLEGEDDISYGNRLIIEEMEKHGINPATAGPSAWRQPKKANDTDKKK